MKQSQKQKAKQLWIRILLIALVSLMVASLAFYTIWMLVDQIKENIEEKEKEKENAGSETNFGDTETEDEHENESDTPEIYY